MCHCILLWYLQIPAPVPCRLPAPSVICEPDLPISQPIELVFVPLFFGRYRIPVLTKCAPQGYVLYAQVLLVRSGGRTLEGAFLFMWPRSSQICGLSYNQNGTLQYRGKKVRVGGGGEKKKEKLKSKTEVKSC